MPENTIFERASEPDSLGSRISRARVASGISVSEIAKTLGVKKSTFETWQADGSTPRAHYIPRIAGILGISQSWLLGGVGEAPEPDSFSEEVKLIRRQFNQIKTMRDQTGIAINNIEAALERLASK